MVVVAREVVGVVVAVEGAAGAEVALARASAAALAAARQALRLDMMMIGCGLNRAPDRQTWWIDNGYLEILVGGRSLR